MSLKDAFSGLKEELGQDLKSENNTLGSKTKASVAKNSKPPNKTSKLSKPSVEEASPPQKAKRKLGKRSNPEFTQAPAFIRKATHRAVKVKLIMNTEFNDYSELVEALLVQWLEQDK
ncbi:MAG: hypothetical protein AAFY50_06330 [Cyanobacteria bacterium J06648_1]